MGEEGSRGEAEMSKGYMILKECYEVGNCLFVFGSGLRVGSDGEGLGTLVEGRLTGSKLEL